jgi:hypothetical protein
MARSSSARRHARRVEDLRALRAEAPQQFRRVWQLFFQGWSSEVGQRARAQMQDTADEPIPAIFAVFDGARRLARDIGADTDRHVAESLIHLEHLCSKAVAGLIDGRLYAFGVETVYVRRGKARRTRGSGPTLGSDAKPSQRTAEAGKAREAHRAPRTTLTSSP